MNKNFVITNVDIFCPSYTLRRGSVLIKEGKIENVSEIANEYFGTDFKVIDGQGKLLLPGFIDIHVNGGGGGMSIDGSIDSIKKIIKSHSKFGTTSMLITTISVQIELLKKSLRCISEVASMDIMGSKIIGIHLEGPFLSEAKRGAHSKQFLKPPDIDLFEDLLKSSSNEIKILSLAPELEASENLIKHALSKSILVGFAHSDADYQTTKKSIAAGLKLCTHIFNGMNSISHKEPGPIPAFLLSEDTFVEIISDGIHISPIVMEMVLRIKDHNKIILITDAVSPAGTNISKFSIQNVDLEVRGNSCFIPGTNNLAGSSLTMNTAIKLFIENTNCDKAEAIKMATINPATLLGIDKIKGSIELGKDADLVLVDEEFNVYLTLVEGMEVFNNLN